MKKKVEERSCKKKWKREGVRESGKEKVEEEG